MSKNIPINLARFDNKDYEFPKHLILLNNKLIEATLKPKRIIVSVPPRHGKTELISKYFPAWYLCNYPNYRLMLIMASNSSAANNGRKIRDLVNHYGKYYKPKAVLNDSSKSVSEFAFQNYNGEFYGIGAGSANIVGKGANFMIIDDPISDFSQVASLQQREKLYEWFQSDIFNRLEPNGSIVIVMQRWHVDDIVGKLLENNTTWEYISIPAICNSETDVLNREIGEPLWESRYDIKTLNEIKLQTGDYWFNCKYQQQPILKTEGIFPDSYFQYNNDFDISKANQIVISYDTAYKDNELNDYTGYCVGALLDNVIYIIESGQKKLQYPRLKEFIEKMNNKYKPYINLIEDKSSGQSLLQEFKSINNLPIKAIQVKSSKLVRAQATTTLFEQKLIYFVGPNHNDAVNQLIQFPYAPHDDIVDSITQLLLYFKPLIMYKSDRYF